MWRKVRAFASGLSRWEKKNHALIEARNCPCKAANCLVPSGFSPGIEGCQKPLDFLVSGREIRDKAHPNQLIAGTLRIEWRHGIVMRASGLKGAVLIEADLGEEDISADLANQANAALYEPRGQPIFRAV